MILLFLLASGVLTAMFIHRFATRATRRSDIWDCGYPDPSPADAIHQFELRHADPARVRHHRVPCARDASTCRGRARPGPRAFHVKVLDPAWRYVYGPAARAVLRASAALNQLQFLTIRRYLTLVFATLVLLLLVVAAWR